MKNVATVEMKNINMMNRTASPTGLSAALRRMALRLAALFSFILGEKVSAAYSLCLLNVMIAGTCAFLFGGASLMVQLLLLVWLGVAVWQACIVKK